MLLGEGPTVPAIGVGEGCSDICYIGYYLFFFLSPSGRQLDINEILSQRAVKSQLTNQPAT